MRKPTLIYFLCASLFAGSCSRGLPPREVRGPLVSFNFDDGFRSSYKHALPIFDSVGFKTTQYIITGCLGKEGYVSEREVLEMEMRGHEIGAHTRMHPHLTWLPFEDAWKEISGSREDLLRIGVPSVETLSYPYGDVNDRIVQLVRDGGFQGARRTHRGVNDRTKDPFLLDSLGVRASTSFEEIKDAIDEVRRNGKWLIIVFHRTDEDGDAFSVRHELVESIVAYVKEEHIPVVTNAEGVKMMNDVGGCERGRGGGYPAAHFPRLNANAIEPGVWGRAPGDSIPLNSSTAKPRR